jgi:hypothetical protein
MMEAVRTSEMSAHFKVTTQHYIPEDSKLQFIAGFSLWRSESISAQLYGFVVDRVANGQVFLANTSAFSWQSSFHQCSELIYHHHLLGASMICPSEIVLIDQHIKVVFLEP